MDDLDKIDWDGLRRRDFKRDPEDPSKVERYEAEALVHRHVPIGALHGIACYDEATKATLEREAAAQGVGVRMAVLPNRYFQ